MPSLSDNLLGIEIDAHVFGEGRKYTFALQDASKRLSFSPEFPSLSSSPACSLFRSEMARQRLVPRPPTRSGPLLHVTRCMMNIYMSAGCYKFRSLRAQIGNHLLVVKIEWQSLLRFRHFGAFPPQVAICQ
jgi:hypothetical protein